MTLANPRRRSSLVVVAAAVAVGVTAAPIASAGAASDGGPSAKAAMGPTQNCSKIKNKVKRKRCRRQQGY